MFSAQVNGISSVAVLILKAPIVLGPSTAVLKLSCTQVHFFEYRYSLVFCN